MYSKEKAMQVLSILKRDYPNAGIALRFVRPFQLLVAVILSAQCTDERVNQVTPVLFARFPGPEEMCHAELEELEQLIYSTGFYRNKAANIRKASCIIVERFGGQVPNTMKDLLTLPGVARKTANIVLYNAYGVVEGIPVDTHVKRLANRLGWTTFSDPDKIEQDLMHLFPREEWGGLSYILIEHGRAVCKAKRPLCNECHIQGLCPFVKEG
jgi:endonuclease-3